MTDSIGVVPISEERFPGGYDYPARFPQMRTLADHEGGVVYTAHSEEGWALITDEGTMADLLDIDDQQDLVSVRIFASESDRTTYASERYSGPERGRSLGRRLGVVARGKTG